MKQYSVLSVEGNVANDTGAVLLSAITSNVANNATGFFSVPSGTTAQRPASPVNGMLRYNTTTLRFEFYANGGWRNMARLDGDIFTGAVAVDGNLTVDTNTLFVDATNDRLGVGTITPSQRLEVVGAHGSRIATSIRNTTSSGYSELLFDNDTAPNGQGAFVFGYGGTGTGGNANAAYLFQRRNAPLFFGTNNTERIRITGAGDVGVGVTSPITKFQVASSGATIGNAFSITDSSNNKKFEVFDTASGNSYAAIRRTANTADSFFIIYPQGTLTTSNVNWNFGLRANSNDFNITTYDGASVVNRLAISNTGNATFGGNVISSQFRISALNTAPASASATGTLGEIRYDADYMYVCVATNTWKRSPLTTW